MRSDRSLTGKVVTATILLAGMLSLLTACAPPVTPTDKPNLPTVSLPAPVTTPEPSPTFPPSPSPTQSPWLSSLPDPVSFTWAPVALGLDQPLDIQNASDGSGRLFLVERGGIVRILSGWVLQPEPFLDLRDRILTTGQEQGLLGLAFHPHYATNGYFFVNYIDLSGDTIIARYNVSAEDPDRADPLSEVVLLRQDQPYANHNGGGLAFAPDGTLFVGLGDGGAGGDPDDHAQDPDIFLGKMLRFDVDSSTAPEVWASGLRNPWRFSFDSLTGDLYIADVGQDAWEEVHFILAGTPPGTNFGWDYFEGSHPFEDSPPAGTVFDQPVAEYGHDLGCSVTGGYVYRGVDLPEWQGIYFYGDFCTGVVLGMARSATDTWLNSLLFETGLRISTFGEDEAGELYLADYRGGTLLRLVRR